MLDFIEMGNGSDSLLECIEASVLNKLGLEYHGRSYRINIVDLEDSKNRYEGVLSVLRDGTEIVAQAKIRARRPFSHAEVSLMDYR